MLTPRIQTSTGIRSFSAGLRAGLLALAGAGFLAGCEQPTGNPPAGSISIPRKGGTTTASTEKTEKPADKAAEPAKDKAAEKPAAK